MEKRICELHLKIDETELIPRIQQLYSELDEKKIPLHPACYLADEWFSPEDVPAIAIPFYLVHPRLKKLEYKMMLEVEGETEEWCLRLLRHETGHALSHAYLLHKQSHWQKIFGSPAKEYSETYRPRPYSRSFVIHLENWYAQSHPEEDFAETFAVWLTPQLDWREKYKGWKALKKLEYVDQLMKEIPKTPPLVKSGEKAYSVSMLRLKLRTYYQRRRKLYAQDFPDFYDADLKKLFSDSVPQGATEKAAHFLKRFHKRLLQILPIWTGEKKYAIDKLLRDLVKRCEDLSLYVKKGESEMVLEVVAYLTTLVTNYHHTGKYKRLI